jgi:phosphate transport system substrate-binding protein
MASRAMKESEKQEALKNKINPVEHIIAMDAIVLIVNPKNQVSALTKEQIKDIFTGKITNWKQLGGSDNKIVIVSRDSASGTFETFNELVLKGEKVSSTALMQASNQAVSGIVDKSPGAIGYVGLGYVTSKTKALKVDGVAPSVDTVLSKKYVLSRALFFYTNGAPKGAAKSYIDFILGAQGQKIVQELGFVPLPVKK